MIANTSILLLSYDSYDLLILLSNHEANAIFLSYPATLSTFSLVLGVKAA